MSPSPQMGAQSNITSGGFWPNLLLFLGTAFLCLVIVEGDFRFLIARRTNRGMKFQEDVVYSYEPRAHVDGIVMNDIGCIGDDVLREKGKNEIRVLLLGESTSFSQHYVDVVRRTLQSALPQIRPVVFSCGRPRYTSFVNAVNLEDHLIQYHPDVVVLYMGINDNIYNSFPWLQDTPSIGFFNWKNLRALISYRLFKYYVLEKAVWSRPEFGAAQLRSVPIFRKNMERMISFALNHDAKVVLSTFAISMPTDDVALAAHIKNEERIMEHFWGKTDSTIIGVDAHNEVIRALGTKPEVWLVENSNAVPRNTAHFVDICHLTDAGYDILAGNIAKGIAEAFGEH